MLLSVLVLPSCFVAAEPDQGEAGGGGSGGGTESVGVAQQAASGCCCEVPVGDGKPGRCRTVADGSECRYEEYKEGMCNPLPEPPGQGGCSVSGVVGGHDPFVGVRAFALLFAFALLWRRR